MKRRMLTIGLTLLLAAVGTVSVLLYVRNADARALEGKRAVSVVVADQRVPAGTTASGAQQTGLLRLDKMPAESVPQNALTQIDAELAKLVATADIQPGQLVLKSMFGEPKSAGAGLPIPDGQVAVTVELGVPQRVAGFVKAGSKIAVFDTYTAVDDKSRTPSGAGQAAALQVTRLLLPKLEVLAIGEPTASGEKSSGGGGGSALVTVAATQAEAERLIQRSQFGTLHLVLLTDNSQVTSGLGTDSKTVFDPVK
ncbi:hypothetical protein Lesp02_23220 [Lentzea sp. NBRC 105346]|uniref:Flp pilus assembly protein CpaB n=1 Tax=Lentzea sp. NBRC 105346 TaxID=3032205 RepID=UPI0024A5FE97|nr:Flp pilus assembly protein CpaB [Lentzea sp. NBRC 105346]GLZ30132.1 hypothetical protein Lesp02_23220 [Lentzea sp. NBRC 105346]